MAKGYNKMTYDSKSRVIGCGYCAFEKTCFMHDKNINKARLGCEDYKHYQDINNNKNN